MRRNGGRKERIDHCRGSREEMDGHRNRILAIRAHPTMDSIFVTGGWDDTVHYWDERTSHSQKHFSGPHICGDALDIVADYQVILTGSWRRESTLQVRSSTSLPLAMNELLPSLDLGFLHWSPDQRCLSHQRQLHGQNLHLSLSLPSSSFFQLYTTKFGPKDQILCAGNEQNEAMIYDYSRLKVRKAGRCFALLNVLLFR